jgi:hypothetical protein
MQLRTSALTIAVLAASASAFAPATHVSTRSAGVLQSSLGGSFGLADIEKEVSTAFHGASVSLFRNLFLVSVVP